VYALTPALRADPLPSAVPAEPCPRERVEKVRGKRYEPLPRLSEPVLPAPPNCPGRGVKMRGKKRGQRIAEVITVT